MAAQNLEFFDVRSVIAKNTNVYGRQEETEKILAVYSRTASKESAEKGDGNNSRKELLLVTGCSGTGKTTLLLHAMDKVTEEGFLCRGKFDQNKSLRPFSAVVDSFDDLCRQLAERSRTLDQDFKTLCQQYISNDVVSLAETIPAFYSTLGSLCGLEFPKNPANSEMVDSIFGFTRLQRALRSFLRLAASIAPLVIFIDDLQWADESSLELISSIVEDNTLKCLVTGAYRVNEVNQDHALSRMVDKLETNGVIITKITVGDLDIDALNTFVADTLSLDTTETLQLSEIIHRKTNGNIYFARTFMELLHHNSMLELSYFTMKWTWDCDKIIECDAQDNVVDILASRIQALPNSARKMLMIGSCFGNRFDVRLVMCALEQYEDQQDLEFSWKGDFQEESSNLPNMGPLNRCVEERFVDIVNVQDTENGKFPRICKFSHDRVQQAAYSLIGKDASLMHFRVGRLLTKMLEETKEHEEWMYIVTVDQLNKGISYIRSDDQLRLRAAKMNLDAAHQLKQKSAFVSATEFLRVSLELLGPDKWNKHYDETLDACKLDALLEYSIGHFEVCKTRVAEVRLFARSQEDKLNAEWTSIQCSIAETNYDEALTNAYKVIRSLGERFPMKPGLLQVLVEALRVKKLLKGKTEDDLCRLASRPLTDKRRLSVLHFLAFLGPCGWYAGRDMDLAMIFLRICRISLVEGFSKYTSFGLAFSIPIFMKLFNNFKQANLLGEVALRLIDEFAAEDVEAASLVPVVSFTYHFKNPYRNILPLLVHGYRMGAAVGDMQNSQVCQYLFLYMSFFSGTHLKRINVLAGTAAEEMIEYHQAITLVLVKVIHQATQNLLGLNEDPMILRGRIVADRDELLKEGGAVSIKRNESAMVCVELLLACLFDDDLLIAKTRALELASFKDSDYPIWRSFFFPFYRGLVWVSLVRRGERRYRRYANKELKKLKIWTEKEKCINQHHMYLILRAELDSTSPSFSVDHIHSRYRDAVRSASRSGIVTHQALACEKAGAYFYTRDEETARFYLKDAQRLYREWGSELKASHVAQKYPLKKTARRSTTNRIPSSSMSASRNSSVARLHGEHDFLKVTTNEPFEMQGVEKTSLGQLRRRIQQKEKKMHD